VKFGQPNLSLSIKLALQRKAPTTACPKANPPSFAGSSEGAITFSPCPWIRSRVASSNRRFCQVVMKPRGNPSGFYPFLQVMHESLPQGFPADRIVLTAASVGRDSLLLHEAPGGGFQFYRRMPLEPGLFTTGVFNGCPVSLSNAITFSDGSELTIDGIDRIEW
jgi:hypothetical protein